MHALARQGIEVDGQGGHQGLALAGLHLGDLAFMQHHAAYQLYIEMALAQGSHRRLPHYREGLGQQVIHVLAPG